MSDYTMRDDLLSFNHQFSDGNAGVFYLQPDPHLTPEEQISLFITQQEDLIEQIAEWQSQ